MTEPAVAARRPRGRLRRALGWPPVAGAAVGLALFVIELAAVRQLGMMGATDEHIEQVILHRYGRFIVLEQLAVLGVYLALGFLIGVGASAALALWARMLHRSTGEEEDRDAALLHRSTREGTPRRGEGVGRWLAVATVVAGVLAWRSAVAIIRYPQLYAESMYLRGGVRRTLQLLLTHHVPRALAESVGWVAVAALVLGPFATRRGRALLLSSLARAQEARRVRPRGAIAVVAVSGLGLGLVLLLTLRGPGLAPRAQATAADARPNILILAVDSLRADRVGPGHEALTPHLGALAARGVRFSSAHVTVPRTFPSWMTILTGRWPQHHGVRTMFPDGAERAAATATLPALPSQLAARGYRTAVVSDFAGEIFSRVEVGFAERDVPYFDLRTVVAQAGLNLHPGLVPFAATALGHRIAPSLEAAGDNADPERLADKVIATVERSDARPFFVTAFFSACHFPYSAPDPWYRRYTSPGYRGPYRYHKPPPVPGMTEVDPGVDDMAEVRGLYDGAVGATDAAIGRVLDALERDGLAQNTIVVLMADHGENLYEPERGMGHGEQLHGDHALNIPLVVVDPVHHFPAHTVDGIVRDVDLAPTLAALAGVRFQGGDGVDLLPLLAADKADLDLTAYAETELWLIANGPGFMPEDRLPYAAIPASLTLEGEDIVLAPALRDLVIAGKHRALRTRRWKLNYEPTRAGARWELYDLLADPEERVDVAAQHGDVLPALQRQLLDWAALDGSEVVNGFLVPRRRAP